jgi:hypothetical protein
VKALTIQQPWASLFALGSKQMETRSWRTHVRGPVAIHAGLAMPCRIGERVTYGPYEVERDGSGLLLRSPRLSWPYRLPLGAVVAVGDLFQVRSTDSIEHGPSDLERSLGDHSPGRFAWSITSVLPIRQPVPAKGAQGFWQWEPPESIAADVAAYWTLDQLRSAA